MNWIETLTATVVGEIWIEWSRFFQEESAPPALVPIRAVRDPERPKSALPIVVVFASDATSSQLNAFQRNFRMPKFEMDCTFNAEINEKFKNQKLVGFTIFYRRTWAKDPTPYVGWVEDEA